MTVRLVGMYSRRWIAAAVCKTKTALACILAGFVIDSCFVCLIVMHILADTIVIFS